MLSSKRFSYLESLSRKAQPENARYLGTHESPDRQACVPHMREERLLKGHPVVERLNAALRSTSDAVAAVDEKLDVLFADLHTGEEFAHTELVMILLLAMKNVGVPALSEILEVFKKSRSPELARLRRFAATLLTNEL